MKTTMLTVILTVSLSTLCIADGKLKALIIDGQNNHAWEPMTPVLKAILEECGRFTVDVATSPAKGKDMSSFRPAFKNYDVLVSNYNGADWPKETQKDLETYMKEGGGLVVIHAADNAFGRWEAYNRMIGLGGWGGRNEKSGPYVYVKDGEVVRDTSPGRGGGHGSQFEATVTTYAPDHPIMKGLPKEWRHVKDEIYQQLRGPAEDMTILATIYTEPKHRGSGRNEPALMAINYGKGRVFHDVLGHGVANLYGVGFQVTLQRGAEWAATGKVTIPVPDNFPTKDNATSRKPGE
jgi:type 1 glutamine amidotransferase